MKCFFKLNCDSLSIIQQKTIKFLENFTDTFSSPPEQFWNKINTVDFVKYCPELIQYCNTLNLKVKEISFTYSTSDCLLHIDELPVVAKINFPILNTENTYNQWYSIPSALFDQYPPTVNHFGSKYYSFNGIDLTQCQLLDETILDAPIVFNSQIPHLVKMLPNAKFPRIVLAVMFLKEPLHLL